MEFQLLGPVEASDGARRIALSGSKVHTVLAVLLLARGRVVSDGRLSELLWGWSPPATMNAQIYTYISRLRKLLGPGVDLVRRQPGYQLTAAGAHVDVLEPMGASESLALLATIAGNSRIVVEPEAADVIVRACAGLPLALRAAAIRLAARPHRPAARLARRLADPALRLGELRTGDLDVGCVLGSALQARPRGERNLAGVLASPAGGTFTAAEAGVEAGLSEDTAEELLERLVEGALLEMAGIDAEGRPRYRFHELVRLAALTETAGRTADRRLTAAG
ncbi:helix-turn-helix domain-containing protein [Streptomyces canus]|uniref:AfsR/SARP family transcriptional regulator n=1 Tax=Streptomyces canus TaxID=58343 RepID=UPI002E2AE660|nr:helix-turn-helix domain-containing protein [Streptomyces canus]